MTDRKLDDIIETIKGVNFGLTEWISWVFDAHENSIRIIAAAMMSNVEHSWLMDGFSDFPSATFVARIGELGRSGSISYVYTALAEMLLDAGCVTADGQFADPQLRTRTKEDWLAVYGEIDQARNRGLWNVFTTATAGLVDILPNGYSKWQIMTELYDAYTSYVDTSTGCCDPGPYCDDLPGCEISCTGCCDPGPYCDDLPGCEIS